MLHDCESDSGLWRSGEGLLRSIALLYLRLPSDPSRLSGTASTLEIHGKPWPLEAGVPSGHYYLGEKLDFLKFFKTSNVNNYYLQGSSGAPTGLVEFALNRSIS